MCRSSPSACRAANALARALDDVVHEPVGVTVGVLAGTLARVLVVMVTVGGMLVRSEVRVGMAQRPVTVHVAFEEFVSGGGHIGQARTCRRMRPVPGGCLVTLR
jgi:hypothetical protein